MRSRPRLSLGSSLLPWLTAPLLLNGCTSSFAFTPPDGHPARADTAAQAPPAPPSPRDYRPPSPVEGDGMTGDAPQMRSGGAEPEAPPPQREGRER